MSSNPILDMPATPEEFWRYYAPPKGEHAAASGQPMFPADYVIEAFKYGKDKFIENSVEVLTALFESNLENSARLAKKLLRTLEEKGMECKSVHLRPGGGIDFDLMFVIDNRAFSTEQFEDVINKSWELQESESTRTFKPAMYFLPVVTDSPEPYNDLALVGDGYRLTLNK